MPLKFITGFLLEENWTDLLYAVYIGRSPIASKIIKRYFYTLKGKRKQTVIKV